MKRTTLRIHDRMASSRANGPGTRAVLWVQGCTLGCPGCFNPETHPARGGSVHPVSDLLNWLLALEGSIEGVTISGGEPLQQPLSLARLLRGIRRQSDLTVVLFTGYEWKELPSVVASDEVLAHVDVVVSGRYRADQHHARGLLGSRNQRLHFLSSRYRRADFESIPTAELVVDPDGGVVQTGIDPPNLSVARGWS